MAYDLWSNFISSSRLNNREKRGPSAQGAAAPQLKSLLQNLLYEDANTKNLHHRALHSISPVVDNERARGSAALSVNDRSVSTKGHAIIGNLSNKNLSTDRKETSHILDCIGEIYHSTDNGCDRLNRGESNIIMCSTPFCILFIFFLEVTHGQELDQLL